MVKKIIATALLLIFSSAAVSAQDSAEKKEGVWSVDNAHSSVSFSVRHMVIAKTKGDFKDFEGTVHYDGNSFKGSSAEFTIKVASLDTDNEKRDEHLRSADFFDVEKYPDMTFKSTKVIPVDENNFKLVGDLTIKDVTREVTFDCEFYGSTADPWGNTRAGFSARSSINRQDFNITWSKALETGGLVVGDEVEIMMELELVS